MNSLADPLPLGQHLVSVLDTGPRVATSNQAMLGALLGFSATMPFRPPLWCRRSGLRRLSQRVVADSTGNRWVTAVVTVSTTRSPQR